VIAVPTLVDDLTFFLLPFGCCSFDEGADLTDETFMNGIAMSSSEFIEGLCTLLLDCC
jgi:hypothetical protein